MDGKVIWIINHYALTPAQGGLCRHYYFAKELIKRGYTVRIFTSSVIHNTSLNMIAQSEKRFFKDVEYNGVNYTYLKSSSYHGNGLARIKNMLGFAGAIKKIWKKYSWEKPDIIYTSSPDLFTARNAVKFAKKHKLPCVTEVRDLWPLSVVEYKGYSNSNPLIKMLYGFEKKIYQNCDALIFTMEGGKDYIRDKKWDKKVDLDKVFHINNGLDVELQREQREEFTLDDGDLNGEEFKVIYAGSVRTANSVDLLVRAAEMLQEQHDIKFIIYGDGDKREELEKYCAEHNLTNIVFKGRVDKKYIPYICSKASVNVISVKQTGVSKYGVSWNKLFDYMGAGKPIISNVAVNYDLIERYGCGISLPDQNPQTMADAVLRLYSLSPEEYDKMCKNATDAAEHYDYENLTTKLEEAMNYAVEHYGRK